LIVSEPGQPKTSGGLHHGVQAGDVELRRSSGRLGRLEHRARIGESAVRERANQPFEAAGHTRRQVIDRLEDRSDPARRRDPRNQRRQFRLGSRRQRAVVALGVVDGHAGPAVMLAPEQGRIGLVVERVAVARATGDLADTRRERDGDPLATFGTAVEAGGQEPPDDRVGLLGVGARHDDRELVATDAECPVGAAQVGGDGGRGLAQDPVTDRVPVRVVDALEIVEVDDRQDEWLVVPDRGRPLTLHLLLEGAMVAEPGQGVAQGLCASPVVGVLEDDPGLLEALSRFEHPAREPDRQRAEDDRQPEQTERRHDQRCPEPPGQAVDDRRGDGDRDGEHRDEREEEAKPDQSKIGRFAEKAVGTGIVVDEDASGGAGPDIDNV